MFKLSKLWDFIYQSGKEEAFWSSVKWVGEKLLGGGVMAGLSYYYGVVASLPAWQLFLLVITAGLIGIWSVNGILFGLRGGSFLRQSLANKSTHDTVEFFPSREAMEARFPLSTIFTGNNEIYGHFLSGEGIFSKHPGAYKYVKKLVLANPHCGLTKDAQRLAMNDHQDTPLDITKVTDNATARKIPVRWFDHALGMGFLFCNPDFDDGWVHIELAVPFLEAGQKLGIRIEKSKNPEVFKRLYAAFNDTWDGSGQPEKVYFV